MRVCGYSLWESVIDGHTVLNGDMFGSRLSSSVAERVFVDGAGCRPDNRYDMELCSKGAAHRFTYRDLICYEVSIFRWRFRLGQD